MKKTLLMSGVVALSFAMPVWAQQEPAATIVEPTTTTKVVTPDGQTTVVVEEKKPFRDAITGEPVDPDGKKVEEESLRDKVRSKMKE